MTSTSVSTAEAFLKHCCCSATGREGKMWTGGQKLSNHKLPLQQETSAPTSPTPLWLTHSIEREHRHTHTHTDTHTHTQTHTHTHTYPHIALGSTRPLKLHMLSCLSSGASQKRQAAEKLKSKTYNRVCL